MQLVNSCKAAVSVTVIVWVIRGKITRTVLGPEFQKILGKT